MRGTPNRILAAVREAGTGGERKITYYSADAVVGRDPRTGD